MAVAQAVTGSYDVRARVACTRLRAIWRSKLGVDALVRFVSAVDRVRGDSRCCERLVFAFERAADNASGAVRDGHAPPGGDSADSTDSTDSSSARDAGDSTDSTDSTDSGSARDAGDARGASRAAGTEIGVRALLGQRWLRRLLCEASAKAGGAALLEAFGWNRDDSLVERHRVQLEAIAADGAAGAAVRFCALDPGNLGMLPPPRLSDAICVGHAAAMRVMAVAAAAADPNHWLQVAAADLPRCVVLAVRADADAADYIRGVGGDADVLRGVGGDGGDADVRRGGDWDVFRAAMRECVRLRMPRDWYMASMELGDGDATAIADRAGGGAGGWCRRADAVPGGKRDSRGRRRGARGCGVRRRRRRGGAVRISGR